MEKKLEIYVHIPFCAKKCNYCDFLSACFPYEDQENYIKKIIEELIDTSAFARGYTVSSLFIGGGTPSLIDPDGIKAIIDTIRKFYSVSEDAEITIECNPGSTLRHKFVKYREAGINRLSIGLQSADNEELKTLGRIHTFEEFLKCFQVARMEGFDNINVDLINCFPTQTAQTWKKTLKYVLMLRPEHVSVYNLIVEDGTPFGEMQKEGLLELPSEEEMDEIDRITKEVLTQQRYQRYEVSNYAKDGHECRHNKGYWTGVPYLGFGTGAASYFEGIRYRNESDLYKYLESPTMFAGLDDFLLSKKETEKLTKEEKMKEFMILGLRLTEGVSETDFYTRFGVQLDDIYGEILDKYIRMGLMKKDGYRVGFTDRGMDVSNIILAEF
ncbi:MAG: radical SAM family heme chaperone HemW [Lachnospiraceae bacterium]|nr:radical SAM family heme chaperone HemW [Lachnospiraceae bacterium]